MKPVAATTMPVMVIPRRATNLKNMNISPILVPSLVETQFSSVTSASPAHATPLLIHGFTLSTSAPTAARTMYSPKMIAMIAAEPGLSTKTAHHANRNPARSPKILERYAWAPPLSGIAPPSSAKLAAPVHASSPATAQTINEAPGEPAFLLTWPGEEKMPDPIMSPTMSERPFR